MLLVGRLVLHRVALGAHLLHPAHLLHLRALVEHPLHPLHRPHPLLPPLARSVRPIRPTFTQPARPVSSGGSTVLGRPLWLLPLLRLLRLPLLLLRLLVAGASPLTLLRSLGDSRVLLHSPQASLLRLLVPRLALPLHLRALPLRRTLHSRLPRLGVRLLPKNLAHPFGGALVQRRVGRVVQ
jgi:hypothetical protein